MDCEVVIPKEPSEECPKGAALLKTRRDFAFVAEDPRQGFAECCAQAAKNHRLVRLPAKVTVIGRYSQEDGELRVLQGRHQLLESWIGHRLTRNDLEARDSRSQRRSTARRLTMQGRYSEAWRIDKRLGL
jgi:hypothetical protein